MTDPRRLLDEGATDFERELLQSASNDVPPDEVLHRSLDAAGLGAIAGSAAGGAPAPLGGSLFKWLVFSALGLATGGILAVHFADSVGGSAAGPSVDDTSAAIDTAAPPSARPEKPIPPEDPPTIELLATARSPVHTDQTVSPRSASPPSGSSTPRLTDTAREASTASPIVDAAPTVSASAGALAVPSSNHAPSGGAAPSLMAEVASLDRARAAAGNPAQTLHELERHRREFPSGALGPEATVLQIEALLRLGDRASATALARQFLATQASAPHATRVRSLFGGTNP